MTLEDIIQELRSLNSGDFITRGEVAGILERVLEEIQMQGSLHPSATGKLALDDVPPVHLYGEDDDDDRLEDDE